MPDYRNIKVVVNGVEHELDVETRTSLGDFLRQEIELTGTH